MHNCLVVFLGDQEVTDDVVDASRDPDFSAPVPTWGICRPQVRRHWAKPGGVLVFLAYYKCLQEYLVKGYFEVGEVISYVEALERFPNRRNVIMRRQSSGSAPASKARCHRTGSGTVTLRTRSMQAARCTS